MAHYGFGAPSGIDLAGEIGGILPSPAAKQKTHKERWYPGDTVNAAIGQGLWKVTPLQLVRATSGLADGSLRRPHLVSATRSGFEAPWRDLPQPAPVAITANPANLVPVREGMAMTNQPGGTAGYLFRGAPYTSAGKTGTAQVVSRRGTAAVDPRSLPMHLRHRALYVGFAPAENPTIAVAIAVEGGGYGASTAGPIARKLFDAWLLGKMPEPEPPKAPVAAPAATASPAPATTAAPPATAPATSVPATTVPATTTAAPAPTEPAR
jgi:penicillin-binding protein 2